MKRLLLSAVILLLSFTAIQAQTKLIPARLYGAIPNDGHNDKPALKYLIRKVSAMPNTFIVLERGKYDVKKLHIDFEILQDAGRTEETTPTPAGYKKMFFIFLVPDKENNTIAFN